MTLKKITLVLSFAMTALIALNAQAYDGSKYEKEAKITIDQARKIALKIYPGTIVEEELAHKHGGSGLSYSFDVRANHLTREISVDAKTGKVLKNTPESEGDDD